jgi:hypothetical protein
MNFAKSQVFIEFTFIWINKVILLSAENPIFFFDNVYFVGSYTYSAARGGAIRPSPKYSPA